MDLQPQASTSRPVEGTYNVDLDGMLNSLNVAQRQAVTHDPTIPLQILAGPGSGKTRVLTTRIAYLILKHNIKPEAICAVTFTNKAANEMKDRLSKLLGPERTKKLKLGTFHSICVRFLRIYYKDAGLDSNFTVCDADDSKKLLTTLLKPYKEDPSNDELTLSEGMVASVISKAKAKGLSASDHQIEMEADEQLARRGQPQGADQEKKSIHRILSEIYVAYEKVLKLNNALDFDDLLVYGVKLFSDHRHMSSWCWHILVDEFQDTNTMQYQLMQGIGTRKCVSIVGDPDQSIYGWRSAEVTNLAKMRTDFPDTRQIFLEENYRSTGAILRACLAVVSEDKKRIQKSLHTGHPLGYNPMLGSFADEKAEAEMIAREIKRCTANMGGVLNWGDFAILLRFNALSRALESSLQKHGIPCRILGGHRFFERMEIKDLIAYLQLVDNSNFNPAFIRAIKLPSRGVGDKTLNELSAIAEKANLSQLAILEKIFDGRIPDTKTAVRRKVGSFINAIRTLRRLADENTRPSDLIRRLVELINYQDHLKKTQQDWESRWENVQELITFAAEVEVEGVGSASEANDEGEGGSPLRKFLQTSTLSSAGDNEMEESNKEKVTISTCHAAKGLEWPVVFVPSVDGSTFPFYRSEDTEEERRLLYVGCTRAQALLYLCYATKRTTAGKTLSKELSPFIRAVHEKQPGLFTLQVPRFEVDDREIVSRVLGRGVADEAEVARRVAELEEQPGYVPLDAHGPPANISFVGAGHGRASVAFGKSAFQRVVPPATTVSASHAMEGKGRAPYSWQEAAQRTVTMRPRESPAAVATKSETESASSSVGTKRRLGMGRSVVGYANKKFKPPVV